MASRHIPLNDSSSSKHTACDDDAFEEMVDVTFPPLRYLPMLHDRPLTVSPQGQRVRRESSRERERLYKELVGHDPYVRLPRIDDSHGRAHREGENFRVLLDVKHYKPDEITLKVEGQILTVRGFHHHETEIGFETSEFQRRYAIPQQVDTHALTSKITQDGILCIEAASRPDPADSNRAHDEKMDSLERNFKLSLNVSDYKPDEISIKVVGHKLVIHGETKDEATNHEGQLFHHKQFTRHFSIPSDVNIDALSSRYSGNGKMTIEAPRLSDLAIPERNVEINEGDDSSTF